MSDVVQWIVVFVLALLIYLMYIRGFIKYMRSNKVAIGMSEKQVRHLIGRPNKIKGAGNSKVATYRFHYANRLSAETSVKVCIEFRNNEVAHVYRSIDKWN